MGRLREPLRLLDILRVHFLLLCLGFAFHPAESLAVFGESGFRVVVSIEYVRAGEDDFGGWRGRLGD
jgi:hypothetical protein